jgi:hypothetical protein
MVDFQIAFVTITFFMWEKPYISIFVEIGALRNLRILAAILENYWLIIDDTASLKISPFQS